MALWNHLYDYAEVYTVLLAWVVVPMGFYAAYLFLSRHYRMFNPGPTKGSRPKS